jgi:hypothetical protein
MKTLRYLLAIGLVCGLTGVAKADDFQMVVVDPLPNPVPILSDSFTATLTPCDPSQLPPSLVGTYLGCFTGRNETGKPITSLDILIPVFDYPANSPQSAGCLLSGTGKDLFPSVTCGTTPDGKDYFLDFSGGHIPSVRGCDNEEDEDCGSAGIFTIAEAGVPAGSFPILSVVANAPEPNSLWLMSTGVLSIGLFGAYRRRPTLSQPRS